MTLTPDNMCLPRCGHGSFCGRDLIHLETDLYNPDLFNISPLSFTLYCLLYILTLTSNYILSWIWIKFHFKKNYNNKKGFCRRKLCLYFGIWLPGTMLSLFSYNKIWALVQTLSLNTVHIIFILKAVFPPLCISHERLKWTCKCYFVWSLQ